MGTRSRSECSDEIYGSDSVRVMIEERRRRLEEEGWKLSLKRDSQAVYRVMSYRIVL
jgi:hypothetical protein